MYLVAQQGGYGLSGGWHPGLGDAASTAGSIKAGGSIAAGTATGILGIISAGGGSVLGLTGAALSAAIPIVGVALAGVVTLVSTLVANSGCGQTCVETSSWANQAATALQKNLDAYFALPAPRTQAQQAVAVANFNTLWSQLQQLCGQPGTGNAGVRCISDRQRGACTWKQKYQPQYPGQPQIGQCFDWFNGYLDPIQQDPVVADQTLTTSASGSDLVASLESAVGTSPVLPLLAIAALVGLAVLA